jgi:glycosyltransferase involved in cell wall biosynthesis
MNKLRKLENIDVIFISARDHVEQRDNHGLYEMFKFFEDNLSVKSVYTTTEHSMFKNSKYNVFDISSAGGENPAAPSDAPVKYIPLALQINEKLQSKELEERYKFGPYLWDRIYSKEDYYKRAAEAFIEIFPPHKFIAIADKSEVNLNILNIIMEHFGSKLIILSAVNDTWTGYCSYPNFYNCDKYKTDSGCDSECPAIKQNSEKHDINVRENYLLTKRFIDKNKDSLYLNVGNSYCLEQASQSSLFKDVNKFMIPLKNVTEPDTFDILWDMKTKAKTQLIQNMNSNSPNVSIPNKSMLVMWSAMNLSDPRKGLYYFLNSIQILKNLTKNNFLSDFVFIFAGNPDGKSKFLLEELNIKYVAESMQRDIYMSMLSSSDVYCNTSVEEAGPRTTYEAAAVGTPVISFDRCNAVDFVNSENGALIDTFDAKTMAEKIYDIYMLNEETKKQKSRSIYETYKSLMDTQELTDRWEKFFAEAV